MSFSKNQQKSPLSNQVVLVTGASTGIGRDIAGLLAERGARVFGTARDPRATAPIAGVTMVRLDVTDDASVSEAVQGIVKKAGPIQYLVNNAGYAAVGALEETSIQEAKDQFETNFFGVLRVTSAVLPEMRAQQSGRIVNISSVVGFVPAPYWGVYAASKHAVEGYTETLDHEVRRFGVRALLVQPAYTKSKINGNAKFPQSQIPAYDAEKKRIIAFAERSVEEGDDPRLVAAAVWTALTSPSPKLRYPVGKGVSLSRLRRFVPAGMFDRTLRKQFQLET